MNRNPRNNQSKPVHPNGGRRNGTPPQRPSRPSDSAGHRQIDSRARRPVGNMPRNGGGRQNGRVPQRQQSPKRPQQSSNSNSLSRIALVWVALLAVILIVIMIIAGLREKPETTPAGASVQDTTETTQETTEETSTYPVGYAEYTDHTKSFSAALDFKSGILIDIENGEVVASRNGDARIYPASMTKVMTLIVAAEAAKDLDETFTMTAEITDPLFVANASVAGFLVGEEVTVRDLIYGLILPSGGDGALGLAYHLAGSEEAFAEMMNDKAKELGLTKTHFTNCTGLHGEDHYTTCHEIALMMEYAINDPFMREVLTTYQYTTRSTPEHPEGILLTSTLLQRMAGDESEKMFVQGGKTGYTTEAKNCLVSFATPMVPGMSEDELKLRPTKYILVTAGSGEKFGPVFDAIEVYKAFGAAEADAEVTVSADDTEKPEETEKSKDTQKPEETEKTEKRDDTEKTDEGTASETEAVKIYTAKVND